MENLLLSTDASSLLLGKTRTITELVRALLRCTNKHIVVLSERNGAIDAIAEKLVSLCITVRGDVKKIKDLQFWQNIMTYGSTDAIGRFTKMFLLEEEIG